MTKVQTAATVFNNCATDYERQFMDVTLYGHSFDLFCNLLKQNAGILEIGCGPGNITKYLLEKRPDFNISGTDLAPNMIQLAKKNNPNADFFVLDAKEIHTIAKTFDAIMCGFCLPYLSKEEAVRLIANAASLLNENGIIYISTMEDDYSKSRLQTSSNGEHTLFMYFHEAEYLSETLTKNNFKISCLQRQKYPTKDQSEVTDLILIGQKIS